MRPGIGNCQPRSGGMFVAQGKRSGRAPPWVNESIQFSSQDRSIFKNHLEPDVPKPAGVK